jgi:NADPH:quinone reductase-like Zn-dependent oxidoreductase
MRVIVVESFGGPEVLKIREAACPLPGVGETLIRVSRAGVNYTDLGRRVGDGVRVVGLLPAGVGGYAEYAVVRDELAVPIPDGVDDAASWRAVASRRQGDGRRRRGTAKASTPQEASLRNADNLSAIASGCCAGGRRVLV